MCIEDPFDLGHDLGRTIDRGACQILRREFERAAAIWASEPQPLAALLEPFRAAPGAGPAAAGLQEKAVAGQAGQAGQASDGQAGQQRGQEAL